METISQLEAKAFIERDAQHIFSVTFIKKDGSVRDMVCRRGVHKGVTGAGMNYDPSAHGLVTVFDMQKNAFRMINLNTIQRIKCNGQEYTVTP